MPSGVSASPQGLRWPDSRGGLPRTPQRPGRGRALRPRALGGVPSRRAGRAACSGQGGSGGAGGTDAGPRGRGASDLLWKRMWGAFRHAPCTCSRNPGTGSGPAPHSGTHGRGGAPRHSVAPRVSHSHALAHTQAGQEETWGLRQRLLCCRCPAMWGGGSAPPGEAPHEGDGWEQVPGPAPTPGEGLPGPPTLLSALQAWLPAAPPPGSTEGSSGTLELSEGRRSRQGPRAATRTLANPRPAGASCAHVGVAVAVRGQRWKTGQPQRNQ